MGQFSNAWDSWKRAMGDVRRARDTGERRSAEERVKTAFDELVGATLDDEKWDASDELAWREHLATDPS